MHLFDYIAVRSNCVRVLTNNSDNFSRIYVDVVLNHMTQNHPDATGDGGTPADTYNWQ